MTRTLRLIFNSDASSLSVSIFSVAISPLADHSEVLFWLGVLSALVTMATRIGDAIVRWRAQMRDQRARERRDTAVDETLKDFERGSAVAFDEFCRQLQALESARSFPAPQPASGSKRFKLIDSLIHWLTGSVNQ